MLDVFTDFDSIIRFFEEGNNTFALANLFFVGLSLLFQLGVVYGQNRKRGNKVIAYESMIVVCMLKPAIDAGRVGKFQIISEWV